MKATRTPRRAIVPASSINVPGNRPQCTGERTFDEANPRRHRDAAAGARGAAI
ncbi:hypothetical protein R69919_01724 [Paraburkholderia gardini]|nr:hypothetical protein R69919_01724 [Paraburkholderia gardini]